MSWLLIVVAVGVFLALVFRDTPPEKLQSNLKMFESIAVIGALVIAVGEYYNHVREQEGRKRELVTLLSRQIDPKSINDALFYSSHSTPNCNIKSEDVCDIDAKLRFDKNTWPLIPLFSSAEQCARYEVCDEEAIIATFRQSFDDYTSAYYRIHNEIKKCISGDSLSWMTKLLKAVNKGCPPDPMAN